MLTIWAKWNGAWATKTGKGEMKGSDKKLTIAGMYVEVQMKIKFRFHSLFITIFRIIL